MHEESCDSELSNGGSSDLGSENNAGSNPVSLTKYRGYRHWTMEEIPRCFYVGKGIGRRPYESHRRNHKWKSVVKRFGYAVDIATAWMTNEEACEWEKGEIKRLSTYSTNHSHADDVDICCNFTVGGEGVGGWHHDPNTRYRLSERRKNEPLVLSTESRNKIRTSNRNRQISEETRQKLREAGYHKAKPDIKKCGAMEVCRCDEFGNVIERYESISVASQKIAGNASHIVGCCKGNRKTHKGFTWKYATVA